MPEDPIVAVCALVAGVVAIVIPLVFLFAKARDRSISREIKDRIRRLEDWAEELDRRAASRRCVEEVQRGLRALDVDVSVLTDKMEAAGFIKKRKLELED